MLRIISYSIVYKGLSYHRRLGLLESRIDCEGLNHSPLYITKYCSPRDSGITPSSIYDEA